VLTAITIATPANIHIVHPSSVPNANWLQPGIPSAGQQNWGNTLLATHAFALLPSVVSTHSWTLVFTGTLAAGAYSFQQEPFALDPGRHPPA
jgi:RES domain-containing protein